MKFERRSNLHNIKVQDEVVAGAKVEAAESYPGDLAKVIDADCHNKRIGNVGDAVLYWMQMSSRYFIGGVYA